MVKYRVKRNRKRALKQTSLCIQGGHSARLSNTFTLLPLCSAGTDHPLVFFLVVVCLPLMSGCSPNEQGFKNKKCPPIQPNNGMFSHFSNRQRTYVHAVRIFVHKLLPLSKWIRGRKRRRDKIRLSPLCVRLRMVVMALPFMHGLTLGSS